MSDIFENIQQECQDYGEGVEIEHAMLVNQADRVVTPGIQIFADVLHQPVFLSVAELRDMADEAEKRTQEMVNG